MDMNVNSLVNVDTINQKKFDNIKTDNLDDEKLKEVCNDFESFFLNQIMSISLKDTKIAGDAPGSDIVKSMYTQAVAESSSGSLGISNMLFEYLSENNKKQ